MYTKKFTINTGHKLGGQGSGNGHHGYCIYCGLSYCTDLGYDSWAGTTCIDRLPKDIYDLPENIRSYINFRGLIFNAEKQIFTKSYSKDKYTIKQIINIINKLK